MPSIVGVVSKKEEDVSNETADMLSTLKHRGPNYAGAVIGNDVIFSLTPSTLDFSVTKGHIAIGCNGFENGDQNSYQPFIDCTGELFIVLHGSVFNSYELAKNLASHDVDGSVDSKILVHLVEEEKKKTKLVDAFSKVLLQLDGVYAFAVLWKNKIVIARDPVGVKPLYWGENQKIVAFASERKALWHVGIREVEHFPPGFVGVLSRDGRASHPTLTLKKLSLVNVELDVAALKLCEVIRQAVEKRVKRNQNLGVLFSGGVDSSIIAKVAEDAGADVSLFTTGLEDAYDVKIAERSAENLDLPIHVKTLTLEDVERLLPRVVYAVEETDLMKAGIGLPLYAASMEAGLQNFRVVLTGQGCDELFGGYAKYLRVLKRGGYDKLDEELWRDLTETHRVNLGRDDAAVAITGLKLSVPYLDLPVVRLATSLPPQLKIQDSTDSLRKIVLRKAAKKLGMPNEIADLPKKAIQYGSGVEKAIKLLAKKHSYRNANDYLGSIFNEVFKGVMNY